jgi:hypothetical protein
LKVFDQFLTTQTAFLTTVAFRERSPAGTGPGAASANPPGGQPWRARRSNTDTIDKGGRSGPPPPGKGIGTRTR